MVRSGLLGLGLAALWACAPREPTVYHVERGRTYVEDRAVVWEQHRRVLGQRHRRPQRRSGDRRDHGRAPGVSGRRLGRLRARPGDRSHQQQPAADRARPLSRDLALEVTLRESAGDTEVQPLARFTEQQNDPYRNWPFTQPCRSTGVLERALLDAIGDTAASPAASEPADVSRSL